MNGYERGWRAKCIMCGEGLEYDGVTWVHIGRNSCTAAVPLVSTIQRRKSTGELKLYADELIKRTEQLCGELQHTLDEIEQRKEHK